MRETSKNRRKRAVGSIRFNTSGVALKGRGKKELPPRPLSRQGTRLPTLIRGPKKPGKFPWLSGRTGRIEKSLIRAFCEAVRREFHPQKIILFGSYACGNPTEDSDVDLLIVMPFKGSDVKQVVTICSRVRPCFPLDLLVIRPEQLKKKLSVGDRFVRDVLAGGKVLYEAKHA